MDRIASHEDLCDGLHELGTENGDLVGVAHFDFDLLDGGTHEDCVPVAEAASAVAKILHWIVGENSNDDLRSGGARASALQLLIDSHSRYKSLAAISRDAGVSRSIISLWLLQLRDLYQIKLSLRGSEIRSNCREAQNRLVAAGRHSSVKTKKNHDYEEQNMTHREIVEKFNTLSKSNDRVFELEKELAAAKAASKPVAATPRTPVTIPPQKSPSTAPKLTLSDLTEKDIAEAMDICNREHDTETLGLLYRELQSRRRN
jgi:hypothetical protein